MDVKIYNKIEVQLNSEEISNAIKQYVEKQTKFTDFDTVRCEITDLRLFPNNDDSTHIATVTFERIQKP